VPRIDAWTNVPASAFAAVVAAEQARWRDTLHWDTRDLWAVVEQARLDGRLGGAVTTADDGAVTGYAYWSVHHGEVHCGALTSATPGGTAVLLDALLTASRSHDAAPIRLFASASAPGVDDLLVARGFEAELYAYLASPASASDRTRPVGRAWDIRDLDATAELLRASYAGADAARPFAPRGTSAEWRQYASELVLGHGCGRFRSSLSLALPGPRGTLDGVALVTDIGEGSAHLAQLAVHPSTQGAGLATRIVDTVRAMAAAAGYRRLTLLVRDGNRVAERLYARLGFERRATFASAVRPAAIANRVDTTAAAVTALSARGATTSS
jgi:ribosomal protein S18 acetylase RimI-like enzyme